MQMYCTFVDSNFVFSAVFLRMFEITDFFSLLKGAVDEVFQYCILVLSDEYLILRFGFPS